MNSHLFELINQRAGRADGIDDVMELAATWFIYAVVAVAAARHRMAVAGTTASTSSHDPRTSLGQCTTSATRLTPTAAAHTPARPMSSTRLHQVVSHGQQTSAAISAAAAEAVACRWLLRGTRHVWSGFFRLEGVGLAHAQSNAGIGQVGRRKVMAGSERRARLTGAFFGCASNCPAAVQ